jgi:predicted transcriptional regulator YdeE
LNHYTAIDEKALDGISYYRLKQTDYDGKFTYSEWIAVENKTKTTFTFSVHPNPADSYADLDFKNVNGDLSVIIMDALGHVAYSKSFNEQSQPERHRIMLSSFLSKGTYFIQVLINNEVHLQRLVIQ